MFSNKKVLIVTTTDNMIWQFLVPHIQVLKDNGNIVECACARTGFWFDELKDMGLVMHEINFARNPLNPKNLKGYKQLIKLVKDEKYDFINCHQPVGGMMGRKVAHKFHLPCIYTAHGFHFFKGAPLKNNLIFKPIEKHYSRYTDALVTINNEDFNNAKKMHAKKVYLINGIGIDLGKYKENKNLDKTKLRASVGLNDDDFIVLAVGELNKNKNHIVILEAIKQISNSKIKFVICGQGPRKEEYEKFIKENKLEDRIKLLGFRKDVKDFVQASDIFVMPSLREGLPRSMLEAMAYGKPIVASKIRGCRDLVGNNEGGYLCDPTSVSEFVLSIEKLFSDKNKYNQCSARNKKEVENYSFDKVNKQMIEIYSNIKFEK